MNGNIRQMIRDELLTTTEAAELMGKWPSEVRAMVAAGELDYETKGNRTLLAREDIMNIISGK